MIPPEDLAIEFRADLGRLEEDKHMPYVTSVERLAREEGREEGRRENLVEALEVLLEQKFGEKGLSLLPEIIKIDDRKHLKKLIAAFVKIQSLEEFQRLLQGASST